VDGENLGTYKCPVKGCFHLVSIFKPKDRCSCCNKILDRFKYINGKSKYYCYECFSNWEDDWDGDDF